MIRADGNLVLLHAQNGQTGLGQSRAYALFRVYMPQSEELLFLVRLYDAKTAGGIHVPGAGNRSGMSNVLTEIYDKPLAAMKRCEEWIDPQVVVPEMNMESLQ